jgi:transcriptional regulator with XRE-family HTH domain
MKNRVIELRLSRGWKTHQELADQTKLIDPAGKGISRPTISNIEAFHVTPRGNNLKLLMKVFNCTADEILIYQ